MIIHGRDSTTYHPRNTLTHQSNPQNININPSNSINSSLQVSGAGDRRRKSVTVISSVTTTSGVKHNALKQSSIISSVSQHSETRHTTGSGSGANTAVNTTLLNSKSRAMTMAERQVSANKLGNSLQKN